MPPASEKAISAETARSCEMVLAERSRRRRRESSTLRSSSSLTAIFKKCIARSTTTPCTDDAPVSSWSSPSVKETMSPCAKRWNGSSAPIANPRRSGAGAPASSDSAPDPPTRGFKTRITASRCNVPSRIPRRPNRAYPSRCNRARSHVSRRSFARSISSSSSRRSALANFSRCAVKPTRSVAREDPRWRVPFAPRDVPRGLPEEDEEAFAFGSASRRWEKPRGVEEDADADGSAAPNRAQILRRSSWALAGSLRAAGERRGPPRRSAKGDSPLVETRTATRLRMPAGRTPGAGGGGGGARMGFPRPRPAARLDRSEAPRPPAPPRPPPDAPPRRPPRPPRPPRAARADTSRGARSRGAPPRAVRSASRCRSVPTSPPAATARRDESARHGAADARAIGAAALGAVRSDHGANVAIAPRPWGVARRPSVQTTTHRPLFKQRRVPTRQSPRRTLHRTLSHTRPPLGAV